MSVNKDQCSVSDSVGDEVGSGAVSSPPKIVVLGASYSTGNMGVDALLSGTIASILTAAPEAEVVLLDYGLTPKTYEVEMCGREMRVRLVNIRFSWKAWLPNNVARLLAEALLGRLLPRRLRGRMVEKNPWLRELSSATMICSLAGGDSFCSIYRLRRLLYIGLPHWIVLGLGMPLVHLPQTLGPFHGWFSRAFAGGILRCSQLVFSRDTASMKEVRGLPGGESCDLRFSHDMAFALEGRCPLAGDPEWLSARREGLALVGVNVSGLLFSGGYDGVDMFGLKGGYKELVLGLVRWILKDLRQAVILVSHVTAGSSAAEDDARAGREIQQELQRELQEEGKGRLFLADPNYDHREVKYCIGKLDMLIGSRMHACIAALSQGVPAIGLAYSRKFEGVFESVGAGSLVLDLRDADLSRIISMTGDVFENRARWREELLETAQVARRNARELVRGIAPSKMVSD